MTAEERHDLNTMKISDQINLAIQKNVLCNTTTPKAVRETVFQLVREVKTIVGFDREINSKFKRVPRAWYKQSLPFLKDETFDVVWAQFIKCWDKASYPTDGELFRQLSDQAEESSYPPVCEQYDDLAREVIKLCAVLDTHWSPDPFYLSCRMASREYGLSHSSMADILRMLVMEGVLELVEQGTPAGRASRYRFLAKKGVHNGTSN